MLQATPDARERPLAGIAANGAAFCALSIGDAMSKVTVAVAPLAQIIALRALFLLLMLVPFFLAQRRRGFSVFETRRPWLHLARFSMQLVSVVTFFAALRELPLTTITAIMFIAPMLVAVAAVPILGERIGAHQLVAITLGLVGCMIILRPDGEGQFLYMALSIFSAATWALSMAMLRLLTRTESHGTILLWGNGCFLIVAGAFSVFDWRPIEPTALGLIAGMAATQVVGQWFSMTAFRIARAATVAPMQYTQILWATLFGVLVFNEAPPLSVWLGAILIIAGGVWLMREERRRGLA